MRKALFILLLTAAAFSVPEQAWALFQLEVSPRRGGQSLHFESAQPGGLLKNEEVTLSVTTDEAVQYRILQTVYQPLTHESGRAIPAGAFIVFSPSEPLGTLRTKLETPVAMGQSQIYTSNSAGDTDTFVLVYNVHVPEDQPGGVYRTQVTFSAEPVNAQPGVSPSTVRMDVRVEIAPQFRISLQGARGTSLLDLGAIDQMRRAASEELRVLVESNATGRYRLVMQPADALVSEQGEVLDPGVLTVAATGGRNGQLGLSAASAPLDGSPVVFYHSSDGGSGDEILLVFSAAPSAEQKAGIYSGALHFRVESDSPFIPRDVFVVPLRLEVRPLFSLETKFDTAQQLHFGTFRTGEEKEQRRVVLNVLSNLGEPYQISQVVSRKMSSAEGTALPPGAWQFRAAEAKSGSILTPAFAPVKEGETAVYSSDNKGTPETLVLEYTLSVPPDAKMGSYSSEIKYSITSL